MNKRRMTLYESVCNRPENRLRWWQYTVSPDPKHREKGNQKQLKVLKYCAYSTNRSIFASIVPAKPLYDAQIGRSSLFIGFPNSSHLKPESL